MRFIFFGVGVGVGVGLVAFTLASFSDAVAYAVASISECCGNAAHCVC